MDLSNGIDSLAVDDGAAVSSSMSIYHDKIMIFSQVFQASKEFKPSYSTQTGIVTIDDVEELENSIDKYEEDMAKQREDFKQRSLLYAQELERIRALESQEEINGAVKSALSQSFINQGHPVITTAETLSKLPRLPFNAGENIQICNL